MDIAIYIDDIKLEKRKEILRAVGIEDPKELNWDLLPVFELYIDDEVVDHKRSKEYVE